MDKLYYPGEHHSGVQIFYPHKTIIGLQVQLTTNNWNDKESTKAGTIKEQSKKYNYQVGFPKGKQRIMEYKYLINMLNRDNEDDYERSNFDEITYHW